MAPLSASVLWCGVAGRLQAATDDASVNLDGLSLLAQEGREFGCSGCSMIELVVAGSYRMTLKAPIKMLQWKAEDFISCESSDPSKRPAKCGSKNDISAVEEFAARRGLMRMLQQEDHEVFSTFREWRTVPSETFSADWVFSEAFDGRLLLLPFYHRSLSAADSVRDVTLLMHMDASRLKNLDLVVRSWNGPVSIVVLMCAPIARSAQQCVRLFLQIRGDHRRHIAVDRPCPPVFSCRLAARKYSSCPFRLLTRALPSQRALPDRHSRE
jgi:hypothetical protein